MPSSFLTSFLPSFILSCLHSFFLSFVPSFVRRTKSFCTEIRRLESYFQRTAVLHKLFSRTRSVVLNNLVEDAFLRVQ